MTAPELILASSSPTRQRLLSTVGLAHRVEIAGIPEVLVPDLSPEEQARKLAFEKARVIHQRHPGSIVVGADQVMATEAGTFGKPPDEEAARRQLAAMAGRSHRLITGVAVLGPGDETWIAHEETRLHVRDLTEQEIDAYVATGEWQGCAGGYRVEGRGLALFSRIDGDWTNVLGLPMPLLLGRLRELGIPLFR